MVFFYSTPVLPLCDVIIWTKFYKNTNISSITNGKLTKSVSNFRKFNNPSNELSLKWIISTCRTPWSVLIASGRFFEENYRRDSFIFLFFYNIVHVSVNISSSSWKLYLLVAITSDFLMDNIPVINRLAPGIQKKVRLKSFGLTVIRSNLSSGN